MFKIAFIKYGGLAAGGTEIHLQTLAANLPSNTFDIDYFYCDATKYIGSNWKHPDTDIYRKQYLENSNVNLIKFHVEAKDITKPYHPWLGTDFWQKFNETDYDLIISARAGHPEYPFTQILNTPIIFFVTLIAGVDNQKNIYKNVLISNWAAKQWIKQGGQKKLLKVLPLLKEINFKDQTISKKRFFTYGFHQRDNDEIFSPVPLKAYKKIMSNDTAFTIMGGSNKYSFQAKELELINFNQLPHTGSEKKIHTFLKNLDVFAHGRSDGETFGQIFVEAMYHGLPIISHKAQNNAQVEVVGKAGKVFSKFNTIGYSSEMFKLKSNKKYYKKVSKISLARYKDVYSLEINIEKFIKLIHEAIIRKESND